MKIYHRKNFASGLFMLLLGIVNLVLGAMGGFDVSGIIITASVLITGAFFVIRSLSKNLSARDQLEDLDERSRYVVLKSKSRAFQILMYGCLVLMITFFLMGAVTKSNLFIYTGAGFAGAFSLCVLADICSFAYYHTKI